MWLLYFTNWGEINGMLKSNFFPHPTFDSRPAHREWGFSSGGPSFCISSGIRFLQETIRGLWKKYTQNLATGRGSKALGRLGGMGGLGVGQKADQD